MIDSLGKMASCLQKMKDRSTIQKKKDDGVCINETPGRRNPLEKTAELKASSTHVSAQYR